MIYAAIAQSNPVAIKVYEGRDISEVATSLAVDNGGHYALASDDATIPVYSGKAILSRADGKDFWMHIITDVMSNRDNTHWFIGQDKAEVLAEAEAYLSGDQE